MNNNYTISDIVRKIESLKENYNDYKKYQERLKKEKYEWLPSQQLRIIWEMSKQEEIWKNREKLKNIQEEIKELRKQHKYLNKEQNKKFNKQNGRNRREVN